MVLEAGGAGGLLSWPPPGGAGAAGPGAAARGGRGDGGWGGGSGSRIKFIYSMPGSSFLWGIGGGGGARAEPHCGVPLPPRIQQSGGGRSTAGCFVCLFLPFSFQQRRVRSIRRPTTGTARGAGGAAGHGCFLTPMRTGGPPRLSAATAHRSGDARAFHTSRAARGGGIPRGPFGCCAEGGGAPPG